MKSSSGAFDVDDFISRLINFMGGNKSMDSELPDESDASEDGGMPLDWERLGRKALAKSRRVPTMDFMSVSPCSPVYSQLKAYQARTSVHRSEEAGDHQTSEAREEHRGGVQAARDSGGGHRSFRERDIQQCSICTYHVPLAAIAR